jgi:hypothetical protein
MGTDLSDFFSDIERLRLPCTVAEKQHKATNEKRKALSKSRFTGEFLKGPIPLSWLSAASEVPGKAPLAVGLALWFESGRRRSKTVKLTTAILSRFGVSRKAKYRGLEALERAELINVLRTPRKNPVVTILDVIEKTANDFGEPSALHR